MDSAKARVKEGSSSKGVRLVLNPALQAATIGGYALAKICNS